MVIVIIYQTTGSELCKRKVQTMQNAEGRHTKETNQKREWVITIIKMSYYCD